MNTLHESCKAMKLVKMIVGLFRIENEEIVIMNQLELGLAVERVRTLRLSKEIMQELATCEASQQRYDGLAS